MPKKFLKFTNKFKPKTDTLTNTLTDKLMIPIESPVLSVESAPCKINISGFLMDNYKTLKGFW